MPSSPEQYEAMAMVGYRDEKETFLVDFEQKRWQHDAEQGDVQGAPAAGSTAAQDCPEAVVRRHLGLAGPAHACRIDCCDEDGVG
jgi:hypothetical protein